MSRSIKSAIFAAAFSAFAVVSSQVQAENGAIGSTLLGAAIKEDMAKLSQAHDAEQRTRRVYNTAEAQTRKSGDRRNFRSVKKSQNRD